MSETVLLDIDMFLVERIRRVASANGWSQKQALIHLLEHGLFACEAAMSSGFDDSDADALQAAIMALEQIDNDPGFSLIGRAGPSGAEADAATDALDDGGDGAPVKASGDALPQAAG
ncbi:hypothetical protein [Lysobacter sp. A289]